MRTSGEAKLAAGDEGPKAINLKENSEISDSQELELTDQMDIGESSLSEIDDNSSENNEILSLFKSCGDTKEEDKVMSESSRIDDSSIEWENASDESKSDIEDSESKSKEINAGPEKTNDSIEEINRQQLYTIFKYDPELRKLSLDFIKKIKNSSNKKSTKFKSHINTAINLFIQHLNSTKNKSVLNIDKKTEIEYFFYIFEETINQGLFTWQVFNDLRNNCRTFEAIKNYLMVTFDWDKIDAYCESESNKDTKGCLLEEFFTELLNEDFYETTRVKQLQSNFEVSDKEKYLNNIEEIIKDYSKWRKWSDEVLQLILRNNKIQLHVFNKLVKLKLIPENNNILTFNEEKIKRYCD